MHQLLPFMLLCTLFMSATVAADDAVQRPNILFIAMDDLNDWVGCMGGHPQARTPNLDQLAASGVLFTNAYCDAPACNPSRTAIMTGVPPHRTGLYANGQPMRKVLPSEVLMSQYYRQHAYWSGGSGKILHYFIDAASWDDYFPDKERENPFPRTYYPKKRPVSLPKEPWQYVETDWAALDVSDKEYGGDWLVSNWIGEQLSRPHEKPFFLACGMYRPHEPWFVPKKYYDPFPLDEVQMPPGLKDDDLEDLPQPGRQIGRNRYLAHIKKHGQWKNGVQAYLASIYFSDAMVGRVLAALESGPNRDNTIVVLWSDHGWHLGEKEHWQKFTGWRVCARVPLIVRVPSGVPGLPDGTKPGGVCTRPVNLVDLFCTLNDLTGVPRKPQISDRTLVPLLKDPTADWPHAALTHLDRAGDYAISTEQWRYIHYTRAGGGEELYDIQSDPYEWTNLAADPAYAERLQQMRSLAPKDVKAKVDVAPDFSKVNPKKTLEFHRIKRDEQPPRSANTAKHTLVIFENQLDVSIRLHWVNPTGELIAYGEPLQPGKSRRMRTFAGHTWLVTDDDHQAIGYGTAEYEPARLLIE